MSIIDALLSVVAPFDCLNCGVEGPLLCSDCIKSFRMIPSRCYRCHKQTTAYKTCKACRSSSTLYSVQPVTVYAEVAQKVIWALKYAGAQEAGRLIAKQMAKSEYISGHLIVVPCPTTTRRRRQRGFDQAELIARRLSQLSGAPLAKCLARTSQAHQVGANRTLRLKQLRGAYRVKRPTRVYGKHVVLVDDVLTTGATLEAAARALRLAGANTVSAIVFAQA